MKPIVGFFVLLFALFAFTLWWDDPANVAQRKTSASITRQRELMQLDAERERQQLRLEREAQAHQVRLLTGPVMQVGTTLATLGVIYALFRFTALGEVALRGFFRRRDTYVYPDQFGRLPHQLQHADYERVAAAALAARHATDLERARQSYAVPSHLHYAPSLEYEQTGPAGAGALPGEPAALAPDAADMITFAALLTRGQIGPGQPLLLGIDQAGNPVEGSWLDLFSVGIGGLSGSGKSWTGAYLLSQAMLNGARVAILDPHAGDGESISSRLAPFAQTGRYLCGVADTPQTMRSAIALVADELTRRKHGKGEQIGGRRVPWIILCDEFSALMRGELAEPLALLFEAIAQEGRKLQIYGMALGQVWTATRSGGTELRDSLASAYLHRLRPSQARYLSGLTAADLPGDIHELPAGTAYLFSTTGELTKVTVPRMHDSDIQRVAGLLTGDHPTMDRLPSGYQEPAQSADVVASGKPDGSQMVASPEQATTASQCDKPASGEARRAAALFLDGNDLPAIVYELRGVKSNAGRRYQTAVTEVQQLLREGLGWKGRAA